jgi:type II secretory pathway component PulK
MHDLEAFSAETISIAGMLKSQEVQIEAVKEENKKIREAAYGLYMAIEHLKVLLKQLPS